MMVSKWVSGYIVIRFTCSFVSVRFGKASETRWRRSDGSASSSPPRGSDPHIAPPPRALLLDLPLPI